MTKKSILTQEPIPQTPPATQRRNHWREAASPGTRANIEGWLSRLQCMRAVMMALGAGCRIDREDLITPTLDRYMAMTDPGERGSFKLRNSVAIRDAEQAIRKIETMEQIGFFNRSSEDDALARRDNLARVEAQRQAAIDTRLVELRAKREAEAEAQLRRDAEYGNRGDAA